MFEKKLELKKPEATASTPTPETVAKKATPKEAVKATPKEVVTLKQLCTELKIDPTEARVKLRAAGKRLRHSPGKSWEWAKGSPVIKEVKAILKGEEKD